MRAVSVIGVGMTPFGKFPDRNTRELGAQAIREALKDCTIPREKIQGLYCSNQYSRQAGQPAAFDAGISRQTWYKLETGREDDPHVSTLMAVGAVLAHLPWRI